MSNQLEPKHYDLWNLYIHSWSQLSLARKLLFNGCGFDQNTAIVDLIKWAVKTNSERDYPPFNRFAIYDAIEFLTPEAQCQLFEELFPDAIQTETGRTYNPAERILGALPAEWLQEQVRQKVQVIITTSSSQINTDLIGFVMGIDHDLAHQLVEVAINSGDEYQREIGEYFLGRLKQEAEKT